MQKQLKELHQNLATSGWMDGCLVYKVSGNVEFDAGRCFRKSPQMSRFVHDLLTTQTSESLINQLQSDDQTGWNQTSRFIYQDENKGER